MEDANLGIILRGRSRKCREKEREREVLKHVPRGLGGRSEQKSCLTPAASGTHKDDVSS